jgi:hypothetical protein
MPFQRSARAGLTPTAQASAGEAALTLVRSVNLPGLGVGTRAQAVPFQCSARVVVLTSPSAPTAQASLADSALTPLSALRLLECGMAVRTQRVPFQCSASPGALPTAHASEADTALTLVRKFPNAVDRLCGAAPCCAPDGGTAAVSATTSPRPPATSPHTRAGPLDSRRIKPAPSISPSKGRKAPRNLRANPRCAHQGPV